MSPNWSLVRWIVSTAVVVTSVVVGIVAGWQLGFAVPILAAVVYAIVYSVGLGTEHLKSGYEGVLRGRSTTVTGRRS